MLVNVTSEAPTQLLVAWAHAPGGRSSYQVTIYQESTLTATSIVGPKADSTSFLGLTPGTKYKVETISRAGPLYTAAANVSAWTCEWVCERHWERRPLDTLAPLNPISQLHTKDPK